MADTAFQVPAAKLGRFTSSYRTGPAGRLEPVDDPRGQWSGPPRYAADA